MIRFHQCFVPPRRVHSALLCEQGRCYSLLMVVWVPDYIRMLREEDWGPLLSSTLKIREEIEEETVP